MLTGTDGKFGPTLTPAGMQLWGSKKVDFLRSIVPCSHPQLETLNTRQRRRRRGNWIKFKANQNPITYFDLLSLCQFFRRPFDDFCASKLTPSFPSLGAPDMDLIEVIILRLVFFSGRPIFPGREAPVIRIRFVGTHQQQLIEMAMSNDALRMRLEVEGIEFSQRHTHPNHPRWPKPNWVSVSWPWKLKRVRFAKGKPMMREGERDTTLPPNVETDG